jgi:hypothetical protein
MSSEEGRQLHNQLRAAQDKYVYFLLAVSASAIAFTAQITKDSVFSNALIPLGVAVLFWALSFYCGCRNVQYTNSNIFANADLIKVEAGEHPEIPNHFQYIQAASEGIRKAMESNNGILSSYGHWQFRFLVLGAVSFIFWHLLEMAVRTVGN